MAIQNHQTLQTIKNVDSEGSMPGTARRFRRDSNGSRRRVRSTIKKKSVLTTNREILNAAAYAQGQVLQSETSACTSVVKLPPSGQNQVVSNTPPNLKGCVAGPSVNLENDQQTKTAAVAAPSSQPTLPLPLPDHPKQKLDLKVRDTSKEPSDVSQPIGGNRKIHPENLKNLKKDSNVDRNAKLRSILGKRMTKSPCDLMRSFNRRKFANVFDKSQSERIVEGAAELQNRKSSRQTSAVSLSGVSQHRRNSLFVGSITSFDRKAWYIVNCTSAFSRRFSMLIVSLVIYESIEVPWVVSFQPAAEDVHLGWTILSFVIDMLFIMDMCLNFVTTFVNTKGQEIFHIWGPEGIARNYITSGWFFVDFLACIPLDLFVAGGVTEESSVDTSGLFKVFKMTRLVRIGKLFKRIDDILQASAFRLARLMMIVLIIIHWTACAWMAISYQYLEESELQTKWEQFSTCFFQAAAMLFGQGLFAVPTTVNQEIFASVMTLVGAALQATAFGSVAVLLATFDEEESAYNKKMVDIGRRMRQLEIPAKLQKKVLSYFEYLWLTTKTTSTDADQFIDQLSGPLRSEVKLSLFGDMVQKISFLSRVSTITIEALVLKMQPKAFLQGDKVIRKGQSGNWMAFISSGELAILDPSTPEDKIIRILSVGEYVGEMALLFDVDRTADVMAVMFSRLHILTRDDFFEVRDRYPEDGEVIEQELEHYQSKKRYKQSKENELLVNELLEETD